ncbi:hypothetical protein L3Q65_44695 [Amycolatopsis sp. FU40]|uniref:hypothetical protein n=1 Tax=Amycolatopsis sp. FU40 TaxID=2914159 RepID=UPI001F322546|nr:hypothetical protein [Amycolatopsis sp. FU40]UKD54883.1 hypothetical protein L3Q65_44695 [Amycolatopsis sp. FU40]
MILHFGYAERYAQKHFRVHHRTSFPVSDVETRTTSIRSLVLAVSVITGGR